MKKLVFFLFALVSCSSGAEKVDSKKSGKRGIGIYTATLGYGYGPGLVHQRIIPLSIHVPVGRTLPFPAERRYPVAVPKPYIVPVPQPFLYAHKQPLMLSLTPVPHPTYGTVSLNGFPTQSFKPITLTLSLVPVVQPITHQPVAQPLNYAPASQSSQAPEPVTGIQRTPVEPAYEVSDKSQPTEAPQADSVSYPPYPYGLKDDFRYREGSYSEERPGHLTGSSSHSGDRIE